MIATSKEGDSPTRQEGKKNEGKLITNKASSSNSSPWLRLKDPRIVRVSRAFGGKDRHSKVCTIRGLRDRRVRLSVPTAIQLYDLQDRLGLNQPSKVVDWLLNAAKHEIDELPPLPVPPENFSLNHQPSMLTNSHEVGSSQSNKEEFKISNSTTINWEDPVGFHRSSFWSSDALWRAKSKEVARDTMSEKENWTKGHGEEKQEGNEGHDASNNFLAIRGNQSSLPASLLNNAVPYGSYYHLEPPSSYSVLGSHEFTSQTEDLHNFNVVPLPSTHSLSSGSQILVSQTQPLFPSVPDPASMEIDIPRQINHFQMMNSDNSLAPPLYSLNQSMRPSSFHISMTPRFLHSDIRRGSQQPDKE